MVTFSLIKETGFYLDCLIVKGSVFGLQVMVKGSAGAC